MENSLMIDAHAHLGTDCVYDVEETEEDLIPWYEKTGVQGAVVQPYIPRPYLPEIREIHNRIHRLCIQADEWRRSRKKNIRFWGMASINPHLNRDDFDQEAERCVKELGFVAIKLHPLAYGCNPKSRDGLHVFETASRLGIGVMVHTGTGIPFSDCMNVEPAAHAFPDTPIILAHAGANFFTDAALETAKRYENVFLETSWCGIHHIKKMIKTIGSRRVMFASDHADNLPVELEKYRTLDLAADDYDWCLGKTIRSALNLD